MWYAKVWEDRIEVSEDVSDIDGQMIDLVSGSKGLCVSRALKWVRRLGVVRRGDPRCNAAEFLWVNPYMSKLY